ncbi:MAG: carbohydrate kinase [Eubacteriales bacterium]
MGKVTALGELLIDFVQDIEKNSLPTYEANPGGAPCNVLAMLSKLGHTTNFIGKVGTDQFGVLLENALNTQGISTEGLIKDEKYPTTLAFVHNFANGDRDFSFYRDSTADTMLRQDEINYTLLDSCDIFHFGTLSLTRDPVKNATQKALEYCKSQGKLISFDPNYRSSLWCDEDDAKKALEYGLGFCDILKIADNEIVWFTGKNNFTEGVEVLRNYCSGKLINVTAGSEGSYAFYDDKIVKMNSILTNKTIETTGAGDAFCAFVLSFVLENGLENLTEEQLKEMLRFANAGASIVTTRKGALTVMPERFEVENLIKTP